MLCINNSIGFSINHRRRFVDSKDSIKFHNDTLILFKWNHSLRGCCRQGICNNSGTALVLVRPSNSLIIWMLFAFSTLYTHTHTLMNNKFLVSIITISSSYIIQLYKALSGLCNFSLALLHNYNMTAISYLYSTMLNSCKNFFISAIILSFLLLAY